MPTWVVTACLLLFAMNTAQAGMPSMVGHILTYGLGTNELCQGGKRYCLAGEASCYDDRCICHPDFVGRGDFFCHSPYDKYAMIFNDPSAITFGGERFPISTPCRYLVTHAVTKFRSPDGYYDTKGYCEIKVFSYNARARGKFFVSGVDIFVNVVSPDGEKKPLSVRIVGDGSDRIYVFRVWTKLSVEAGDWQATDLPYRWLHGVELEADLPNNRICFFVGPCGFRMAFRPGDVTLGKDQTQVPGLALAFNKNHAPQWKSLDQVILLPPSGVTADKVAKGLGLSTHNALLYRSLTGDAHQSFPYAPPSCADVVYTAWKCTDKMRRSEAFAKCSFILTSTNFVHCWSAGEKDPHSFERVLKLFGECLAAFCQINFTKCEKVVHQVRHEMCSHHVPAELKKFDCKTFSS
ncbi:uncharacterized protein LOC101861012 [Aplysia californica]|uniref:Uncharacterized protein LOC101861012 n=1 Tax=Aplysia californica TaxID=6500 RepID=A0ABM0K8R4_APLCA|nr:uncharacterized protein LOC101861012 [Aplysia californica]